MGNLAAAVAVAEDPLKWLARMVVVVAKFDEYCGLHPDHRYNFYCTTCNSILCLTCLQNHHDHKILHVYKASHAFCIRTEAIEQLWDPSDICVYRINGHDIFFLQQKQKSNTSSLSSPRFLVGNDHHRSTGGYCQICLYKLIQPHTNFCSIQCKVTALKTLPTSQQRTTIRLLEIRKAGCIADDERRVDQGDSASSNTTICTTTLQLCQSLRRRARKSLHPQRAPLF